MSNKTKRAKLETVEMEEEFALRSDGSVDLNDLDAVMGALGKAMTQPVNFRRIKKKAALAPGSLGPGRWGL